MFHLESTGMREALRQLRPDCIEDVMSMLALYRPGPMQMIPDFIARRHGRVKPTYEHPLMEKSLRETYGIMLYQEQVMQIASTLAGFTMSEADDLRKAMGKKQPKIMAEQRAKFVGGAKARNVKDQTAERVFDLMERFAGYGFNKSHAAAYAMVAYQTAFLKANYPVEFMAALLTSEMANTDKVVIHIDECRAMGIHVRPPDVNISGLRFSVAGDTIRFGLGAIKNVGAKAIEAVVGAREREGPFASLADFCRRLDLTLVNRRVVESLIKAGALDSLRRPRAHLLEGLDAAFEAGQRHQREREQGQASMFDLMLGPTALTADAPVEALVAEWDPDQRLLYEKEVLGFYLSGHPLRRVWDRALRVGAVGIGQLAGMADGARATVCGLVGAIREVNTKSGNRMGFATLEDVEGTIELTVFPETFRQSVNHLRSGLPLLVRGRVEGSGTARKLLAEEIGPLGPELDGARVSAPSCRVRIPASASVDDHLGPLRAILEQHRGAAPLYVHLQANGSEVVMRSRTICVDSSPALLAAVEALLGPESIRFEV